MNDEGNSADKRRTRQSSKRKRNFWAKWISITLRSATANVNEVIIIAIPFLLSSHFAILHRLLRLTEGNDLQNDVQSVCLVNPEF